MITLDDLSVDYIILQGQRSPGICTISGAGDPRNWTEQPGYGRAGATLTYSGNPLSKFDVTMQIWNDKDLQDWLEFAPLTRKPKPVRDPGCLLIEHPILAEIGITQVVVDDRTQLSQTGDGVWSVTVNFRTYNKPRPILLKPDGTIPTDINNPTAKTEAERLIDQKTARFQAARDRDAARTRK